MDESLKGAAEIRRGLEGRRHSDTIEEAWSDFDEILHAALSLSPGLRELLADNLLASLDGPNQKEH